MKKLLLFCALLVALTPLYAQEKPAKKGFQQLRNFT